MREQGSSYLPPIFPVREQGSSYLILLSTRLLIVHPISRQSYEKERKKDLHTPPGRKDFDWALPPYILGMMDTARSPMRKEWWLPQDPGRMITATACLWLGRCIRYRNKQQCSRGSIPPVIESVPIALSSAYSPIPYCQPSVLESLCPQINSVLSSTSPAVCGS